jgi:hypothetical protein
MNDIKGTRGLGITAAMKRAVSSKLPHGVALLCALPLVGCIGQTGDGSDEAVDVVQQAALTNNALTNNALTNNALTNNALTNNALTNNALTYNALTNNALLSTALTDPNAREVFKYIVSCALPPASQVSFVADGVSYTYPGELGLAAPWGAPNGTCNTTCQQWVSACVMARVDYLGVKVQISARGDTPALAAPWSEQLKYTVREGSYFGNIFLPTPQRYACVAPGRHGLPRVCGPSTVGCVVEDLGSCSSVCSRTKADGAYTRCSNENSSAAEDGDDFEETTYNAAVTVFLAP